MTPLLLLLLQVDANRLTHLDETNPYGVDSRFPKLTTPQWVGEEGVEAVAILSIDDMNGHERWEGYLRPILDRLKKIDGRAPVSIMTCKIDPAQPHLQAWLREGLSLETHTVDHPHPLLQGGDFAKAKSTYDRCVDTLASVPGNRPVAFRMPWCDTENTPSPRFYAEIFNARTPKGNFLAIDSSILNLFTPEGPDLSREMVFAADGQERFRRYLPKGSFVNFVENYPYPWVIGRLCWEFPGAVPDDSQPWHRNNRKIDPQALEDLKLVVDATVRKRGVFTLIFHPYNWFRNDQIVELIDHAQAKHGGKLKFLTFKEALERLEKNLLGGASLRNAEGGDNGVRLLDLDNDRYMDVLAGGKTRLWRQKANRWTETPLPFDPRAARFGVLRPDCCASAIVRTEKESGGWHFEGTGWWEDPALLRGLEEVRTVEGGRDRGVRLLDAEGKGRCQLFVGNERQNLGFAWSDDGWTRLPYALPPGTAFVDAGGRDAGLRFVDANLDGHPDVVFSDDERYAVHLFIPRPNALRAFPETGWKRPVLRGRQGEPGGIPPIVRKGGDNGAWAARDHLWFQNEDTDKLPDRVDRRSFQELMVGWLPPPLSPEDSLKAIRVDPAFAVELVAAEPLVHDPVNFEWGPDGKLWVVEFSDYPAGIDGKGKAGGSVRFLEDADGDGRYDRSTLFLTGLNFPTGVMPWRKGVLVSAAPEIFYAEDTDGDGRADVKTVLFSGFHEGNQQHRVNGFQVGLDNWVYGANGGSGGTVVSKKTGASVRIQGRDFRFRPDDGAFEPQPGVTEFGRNRDDWGNWFGNNHPLWGWHYWLPEHYLARNPGAGARTNKRVMEESSLAYRISRPMARPQVARPLDFSTAPCCMMPYRDELFGPDFATSVFVGEVDKNLVHRQVLAPDGVTFTARRAAGEEAREFLASTDNWFRPAMTKTGPDGALYIADMYRLVIEHVEYYPPDVRDLMDFRAGHDKGRIYRVYPKAAKLRAFPKFDGDLVALLESPNGWTRDTAQRLLVHAGDRAPVAALERLARESPRPKTRIQSLWTLEGLGALTPGAVRAALSDSDARVREHAVRIAESFLGDLGEALLPLAADPEVRVRFQVAFTLGEWADPRAGRALVRLAEGPELTLAVLSSAPRHAAAMIAEPLPAALQEPVLALVAKDRKLAAEVMARAAPTAEGMAQVAALREAGVEGGEAVVAHARKVAPDAEAPEAERAAAARLVDLDLAGELLGPRVPAAVQAAALARLKSFRDPKAAAVLLAGWRTYAPALRAQALQALLERKEWAAALVGALEEGRVPPGEIDLAQRQRLLERAELRERASKLFAAAGADRRKILEEYREVGSLKGDPAKGLEHFRKNCASCHLVKGEGKNVGPDLSGYSAKPVQDIVAAVIDPNQAIAGGYAAYMAELRDGRELSGIVAAETPTSLTLRLAGGEEVVVLRKDLRSLRGSSLSMMPEGLEKALKPQDLADLAAFIRGAGE